MTAKTRNMGALFIFQIYLLISQICHLILYCIGYPGISHCRDQPPKHPNTVSSVKQASHTQNALQSHKIQDFRGENETFQ